MLRALVAILLAPAFLLPTTLAAAPSCASVTEQSQTPAGPYVVPIRHQVYELWLETNLVSGLQRVACSENGQPVAPDQRVMEFGIEPGGQPVCAPRVGCVWI